MSLKKILFPLVAILSLQACTNWIYRIDIPQGNFLDNKDVEILRVGMTKEQVAFVLGNPVIRDSFDTDTWYYVYEMKRGSTLRGADFKKQLIINFENDRITAVNGDFELSEDFNIPLDQ